MKFVNEAVVKIQSDSFLLCLQYQFEPLVDKSKDNNQEIKWETKY